MGTFTFDPLDFADDTNLYNEGWQRWDSGSIPHSLRIVEAPDATPLGDRFARQSFGTSNTLHIVMWTAGPEASRKQVRGLLRRSSNTISGVGGRLENDPNEIGYGATLRNNTGDVRWVRVDDGAYNDLGAQPHGFTIGTDVWFWVLCDIDGSNLRMKAWPDGEAEPASWHMETTDANHEGPGFVGFGAFNGTNAANNSMDLAWMGVGTDGDPAPEPTAAEPPWTLTVNTEGEGSVTKNPDKVEYDDNEIVELTATPDSGWLFDSWSGDLTGSTNPDSITMDADKTVTANFVEDIDPDVPTGLAAGTTPAITLTWDAAAGADSYDVERDTVVVASGVTATEYRDADVAFDTEYTYRVRSDEAGVKSDWSDPLTHTPTQDTPKTEFVWDGTQWV